MFSTFYLIGCADMAPESVEEKITHVYVEECATLKGKQICDFVSTDEYDQEVWFHDIEGPVLLDLSAMWCAPCQAVARDIPELHAQHPEVTFLTLLIEDGVGNPPDSNDITGWKNSLGLETPVWANSRELLTSNPTEIEDKLYLDAWPTFYIFDENKKVVEYLRGYNKDAINNVLETVY